MMETQVSSQASGIAFCGLFCTNCSKFIKGKCPACVKNEKATWCQIRKCCMGKNIANCSHCTEFSNVNDCKKYNNAMARVFGFIFNSDRTKCIEYLKTHGEDKFTLLMTDKKWASFPRK